MNVNDSEWKERCNEANLSDFLVFSWKVLSKQLNRLIEGFDDFRSEGLTDRPSFPHSLVEDARPSLAPAQLLVEHLILFFFELFC